MLITGSFAKRAKAAESTISVTYTSSANTIIPTMCADPSLMLNKSRVNASKIPG